MIMEIPLTDGELDTLEQQARDFWAAVQGHDLDTAYIISSTCENPGLLCMYVAGVANEDITKLEEELDEYSDLLQDRMIRQLEEEDVSTGS